MPSRIKLRPRSAPPPPKPGDETLFLDEASVLKSIDSDGAITSVGEGGEAGETNVYVQLTDPGAVGAGKLWVDTTTEVTSIRRRNEDDDGWVDVLNSYHSAGEVGITAGVDGVDGMGASLYGADGDESGGNALLQGGGGGGNFGAQILALGGNAAGGGRLIIRTAGDDGLEPEGQILVSTPDGLEYGGIAQIGPFPRPEVPASPTEQDIVDALLVLGLVTQAAP